MVTRSLCFAGLMLLASAPAYALLFEPIKLPDGREILYARDCGFKEDQQRVRKSDGKPGCEDWEEQVSGPVEREGRRLYPGDDQYLDARLTERKRTGKPYDEVWLYSGGGDSNEGFLIGRVLRRHQMTVRVPPRAFCASACTVAFMGGMFRHIEEGATYEVHSASGFLSGFHCGDACAWGDQVLDEIRKDPKRGFVEFAEQAQTDARYSARRRLAHFQKTLLLPLGKDGDVVEDDAAFKRWANANPPRLDYPGSAQLSLDVQRFTSEGESAAQDILMRIERESMAHALADLRALLPQLGTRADAALKMIEVMFQTSIKETAVLSGDTLLRMGFVTREFSPEK